MSSKLLLLVIFLTLCVSASAAHNELYWNKRADRISAERAALEKAGISSLTSAYFSSELLRCRESAKTSRALSENPDSLSQSSHPISESDISAMADEIAFGMTSYKTISAVSSSPSSADEETVKEAIRSHITSTAAKSGIEADPVFIADIFRGMPSPESALYECAFFRISAESDFIRNSIKQRAVIILKRELSPRMTSATDSFINEIKARTAAVLLNEPEVKTPAALSGHSFSELDGIFAFIDRKIERISGVRRIMPEGSSVKASEISASIAKPEALDTKIFSPLTGKLCDVRPYIRETKDKKILALPKDPDCAALFAAIDSERRKVLKLGKSAFASGIETAEKNMENHINETFRESAQTFFRESEKSRMTDSKNSPEFDASKDIYIAELDGSKKYRDASISFLKSIEPLNSESAFKFIETKTNTLSDIADFTRKNINQCISSPFREFSYTPQIHSSLKQFAAKLDAAAKISKNERESLTKDEITDAAAMNSALSKKINEMLKDAGTLSAGKKSQIKKKAPSSAVHAVSQKELDYIGESVKEKVKALTALSYTVNALNSYANYFSKIETIAESGRIDDQLAKVFSNRTIVPSVPDMILKKINSETAERGYLKKNIGSDIAYIEAASSGTQGELSLVPPLSEKEIAQIKSSQRITQSVKIAGRVLHEKNIAEFDRYAFSILENKYRKATWGKDAPMKNNRTDISANGLSFSIVLPEGFTETDPSFNDKEHSLIKYYSDSGKERVIMIALLPASGKAADALRDWITALGRKPVSKEYPKISDVSLAVLASYKTDVMDAYIIEKNGAHLIIAGECPKTKHAFFQGTIRSVVASAEIK